VNKILYLGNTPKKVLYKDACRGQGFVENGAITSSRKERMEIDQGEIENVSQHQSKAPIQTIPTCPPESRLKHISNR
jgi:hypothetical protein